MIRCAVALCLLVACGDVAMETEPDAALGMQCSTPTLDAPWLATYLDGIITGLPGPRATINERASARTYLQSKLTELGWTPQLQTYAGGANVLATIPATTSELHAVIVGAHFDTVTGSPGANDNGTGVGAVLAVARYLVDVPCRQYPVTIMLFDQEEVGLDGAYVAANMLTAGVVHAVHTVDQIGWDNDGDQRFELELPTSTLEAEYRASAMVVGVPVTKTTTQGTDHEAFRDKGLPAIGLTEEYVGGDTSPYRHTAQDTAATVDRDYLAAGTKLVAHVIMNEL